jgi:hypothetical protein
MLVAYASHHIQHIQKALEQMNLKLAHVVSDITGLTGMGIIKAILTARDVFRLAGINQQYFEAPLHQQLVERNPIDARGFHRHRLDLALLQPVGHSA